MRLLDQVSRPLPCLSMQSMQDSWSGLVLLCIPNAGTMVQERNQISMSLVQQGIQRFSKKGMIAIPLSFTIEGHHKEIGLLKSLEHLLAAMLLHDRVTEGGIELLEDAGAEQEGLDLLSLSLKDLLGQKVQDIALI